MDYNTNENKIINIVCVSRQKFCNTINKIGLSRNVCFLALTWAILNLSKFVYSNFNSFASCVPVLSHVSNGHLGVHEL